MSEFLKLILVPALFVAIFLPTHAISQEFKVDISPEQGDALTGKIRADDLAVNDLAYFYPSQLCREGQGLFLPSSEEPRSLPNEYSFIMKVEILPDKRIKAELLPPSKPSEFNKEDINKLIQDLIEPDSIFEGSGMYCDYTMKFWLRDIFLMPLVSIDGHDKLTDLIKDLESRNYQFAD